MLFWILTLITLAVFFGVWFDSGWLEDAFFAALTSVIPSAIVFTVAAAMSPDFGETRTVASDELRAFASSSSVEGSFFLGSGYIGEELTFSMIVDHGDWYERFSVPADRTEIRVSDDARIETLTHTWRNGWVFPWGIEASEPKYRVYVPEGSISTSIEVTP